MSRAQGREAEPYSVFWRLFAAAEKAPYRWFGRTMTLPRWDYGATAVALGRYHAGVGRLFCVCYGGDFWLSV